MQDNVYQDLFAVLDRSGGGEAGNAPDPLEVRLVVDYTGPELHVVQLYTSWGPLYDSGATDIPQAMRSTTGPQELVAVVELRQDFLLSDAQHLANALVGWFTEAPPGERPVLGDMLFGEHNGIVQRHMLYNDKL